MPKVESANDRAAKNGMIASHRWLGANTAAPLFYGQREQARLTENFLKAQVLDVDIFAIRSETSGRVTVPVEAVQSVALNPGEEITVEVVVSNRNAAHSFPPEVRDLYESWVEFEAVDGQSRQIFHSGFIRADGRLEEGAHVYKMIILDEMSRPITRHQIWLTSIKAYDNTILPGRSDIARFRFRAPDEIDSTITLRARVKYRRFNQEYTEYVLSRRNQQMTVPVVLMAEAEVRLTSSGQMPGSEKVSSTALARRWNDYGIGMLEQAQYGAAADAFRRASDIDPTDVSYMVNAAIAEMRTERFGPQRLQLEKAAALLDRALKIDSTNMRARFYRAVVTRAEGKSKEAAEEISSVASQFPRDREVQRQLGQTLYSLGRLKEARTAFEAVLAIDPTDAGSYQILAAILAAEGRKAEAEMSHSLYLDWRDDPIADQVAARFFAAHPQWSDERVFSHTHGNQSPGRPILTGRMAAPVK